MPLASAQVSYVQWIAFEQWAKLKEHAQKKKVYLMGDIPFGVSPSSADVWANREIFDLEWSGGAPPEGAFADNEFTRREIALDHPIETGWFVPSGVTDKDGIVVSGAQMILSTELSSGGFLSGGRE